MFLLFSFFGELLFNMLGQRLGLGPELDNYPQALSINPRSLFASLESIEECGITLSEPLRTSDAGDQATDHTLTPGEKHPGLKTRQGY